MTLEEHLLICLAEECAELQQRIGKALRFGLDDVYNGETAKAAIMREYADVVGVMFMLRDLGILPTLTFDAITAKASRMIPQLDYARSKGKLC